MADVCLVQMPYGAVSHPSIGLGLLKAYLSADGISAQVFYGNLLWAEDLGLDAYMLIEQSCNNDLLGEWTFSGAAFPHFHSDPKKFISLAYGSSLALSMKSLHPGFELGRLLLLARERAEDFVERMADSILAEEPRIVGCSSVFQQHCASLALLRRIRERSSGVITMLGGANCEGEMGRATHRAFPWVDIVASGEVDGFFAELCATLLARGPDLPAAELPSGVYGPLSRGIDESGRGEEAPRALLANLDETAIPDYDEYFSTLAATRLTDWVTPALLVETSRGCWWGQKRHCTFCGLNGIGMTYRTKSANRVLEELDWLSRTYRVPRIQAVDNILDMRFFKTLLPALRDAGAPYKVFFEVKPNLRREQLELLAAAGVRSLQPGIESLHDSVLALLDKGTTGMQNLQVLKWSRHLGIRLTWGFLFGAPGEDDDWYADLAGWIPSIVHLQPPSGLVRIRYDRFSPYHYAPERFGIRLQPLASYSYVYPLPEAELENLAYYFEDYSDVSRGDIDPTRPGAPRPGLAALGPRIQEWKSTFWSAEPPVLSHRDTGRSLIVTDTRPVARARRLELRGVERAVVLACEQALPAVGVTRRVAVELGRKLRWAEVKPAVDSLCERRLLLAHEDRFLSLAVDEPLADYPGVLESPQGHIPLTRVLCETARESLARSAVKPFASPFVELFASS